MTKSSFGPKKEKNQVKVYQDNMIYIWNRNLHAYGQDWKLKCIKAFTIVIQQIIYVSGSYIFLCPKCTRGERKAHKYSKTQILGR